ncbi:uncharacterized protein LOC144313646 [Canis aureus]
MERSRGSTCPRRRRPTQRVSAPWPCPPGRTDRGGPALSSSPGRDLGRAAENERPLTERKSISSTARKGSGQPRSPSRSPTRRTLAEQPLSPSRRGPWVSRRPPRGPAPAPPPDPLAAAAAAPPTPPPASRRSPRRALPPGDRVAPGRKARPQGRRLGSSLLERAGPPRRYRRTWAQRAERESVPLGENIKRTLRFTAPEL